MRSGAYLSNKLQMLINRKNNQDNDDEEEEKVEAAEEDRFDDGSSLPVSR